MNLELFPCTKRACHCGWDRPVVIRDVGGRPTAIHADEFAGWQATQFGQRHLPY
jgi:hypothetical protein